MLLTAHVSVNNCTKFQNTHMYIHKGLCHYNAHAQILIEGGRSLTNSKRTTQYHAAPNNLRFSRAASLNHIGRSAWYTLPILSLSTIFTRHGSRSLKFVELGHFDSGDGQEFHQDNVHSFNLGVCSLCTSNSKSACSQVSAVNILLIKRLLQLPVESCLNFFMKRREILRRRSCIIFWKTELGRDQFGLL